VLCFACVCACFVSCVFSRLVVCVWLACFCLYFLLVLFYEYVCVIVLCLNVVCECSHVRACAFSVCVRFGVCVLV